MSQALEVLPGGKKTYRSVEVARKQEATSWEMADAIWEDVQLELADQSDSSHRDLGAALNGVSDALQTDGHDYTRGYVTDLHKTCESWPPAERVEGASFTAHYLLRSGTYPNRRANLERLRDRSSNGKVTAHAVKVWISEKKPPAHKTFLQLVDERVRSALKAAANPWHTVAQDDRNEIARLLRVIAEEVQDGTFPAKRKP